MARELPDGDDRDEGDGLGDSSDTDGELLDDEVGECPVRPVGRGSDEGGVPDTDEELYAVDIGIDGAGAVRRGGRGARGDRGVPRSTTTDAVVRSRGVVERQPVQRDDDVRAGRDEVGGTLAALVTPTWPGKSGSCATTRPLRLTVSPASTS